MGLEERAILGAAGAEMPGGEPRHDLAQDRHVVLGLALRLDALDAEPGEALAHPGERALVQEAGEVVGAVGQELAPRDADEEIEELPRDRLRARRP